MARSRRVFLKVISIGAAGTTLGCMGIVEDGNLMPRGGTGAGGDPSQTGGSGSGTGGASGDGAGGGRSSGSGQGGSGMGGSTGAGGQRGSVVDAGAPDTRDGGLDLPRDAGVDVIRDSGTAPRDAGVILQPGDIVAGNVSGLAVGGLTAINNQTVAIGRDAMGVYALTLICTHQGCTAAPATTNGVRQINCPCHGSQFDRNGAVVRGPAARPLVHFSVTIDAAGNIVVHSNTQVAATVRVAP